jgi:His-Xaa-Ser system radical SAM maturase HxsC
VDEDFSGYLAALSGEELGSESLDRYPGLKNLPGVHTTPHVDHLREGDVVILRPKQGHVRTLYRRASPNNALFITERCNSDCVMCPQPPNSADDSFLVDENLRLIQLMDPSTELLGMTGGEPTLLKDDLIRIIQACRQSLPHTALHLLSNGRLFMYEDYAKRVAEAGGSALTIAVPLYSHLSQEHDKIVVAQDGFAQAITGLHHLAKYRQRLEVRVVIHAMNHHRLRALAEFIYRNLPFVAHVTFMQMEIKGYVKKNLQQLWVDPFEYQPELMRAVAYLDLVGMAVSVYNHQLCVLDQSLWPFARKAISDWKNIYLQDCEKCVEREHCGGLFASAETVHSAYIVPFSAVAADADQRHVPS